jgi:hypothetical protein
MGYWARSAASQRAVAACHGECEGSRNRKSYHRAFGGDEVAEGVGGVTFVIAGFLVMVFLVARTMWRVGPG